MTSTTQAANIPAANVPAPTDEKQSTDDKFIFILNRWETTGSHFFQLLLFIVAGVISGVLAWNYDAACAQGRLLTAAKVIFWTAGGLAYLHLVCGILQINLIDEPKKTDKNYKPLKEDEAKRLAQDKFILAIVNLLVIILNIFAIIFSWIIAIVSTKGPDCNGLYIYAWIVAIIFSVAYLASPFITLGLSYVWVPISKGGDFVWYYISTTSSKRQKDREEKEKADKKKKDDEAKKVAEAAAKAEAEKKAKEQAALEAGKKDQIVSE